MSESLTLVIAFDVGRTAPNALRRMCWQARKRVADEAKTAATLAWRAAGSPVWNVPVIVAVTIRRRRRLDPDNALASLKACADALFVCRITPDDSSDWITWGRLEQITGEYWRNDPRVEFHIYPRDPARAASGGCTAAALEIS